MAEESLGVHVGLIVQKDTSMTNSHGCNEDFNRAKFFPHFGLLSREQKIGDILLG
jgi:hypothetical protein